MTNKYNLHTAILAVVLPALLLTGCRFEDEDYFDETAAVRIEHAAQEVQDILVKQSAEDTNGWVLQYFCGTTVAHFEGFNLFARFQDNEKVLLAGNHRMLRYGNKNKYTESNSLYEMLQEDGLVLAFNTWNDVLTPFVDPVTPWPTDAMLTAGTLPKDGAGMAGDHNFVVTSYDENEVVLRGERWGAEVRLVASDRPWEDYIADTEKNKSFITNSTINSYYVTNDTDTLYFVGLRNGRFRYCERVEDPLRIDSLACVFTPNGFRIEKEQTIGDNTFHEFTLAEDNTCLVNEDGSVKVIATWDNYIAKMGVLWDLNNDLLSSVQKSLCEELNAELKKANNTMQLEGFRFGTGGTYKGKEIRGFIMNYSYVSKNKRVNATAAIELAISRPTYGQIKIEYLADCLPDDNLANFENLGTNNVVGKIRALAATFNGVYEMIPDSYFLPQSVILNNLDGSNMIEINR